MLLLQLFILFLCSQEKSGKEKYIIKTVWFISVDCNSNERTNYKTFGIKKSKMLLCLKPLLPVNIFKLGVLCLLLLQTSSVVIGMFQFHVICNIVPPCFPLLFFEAKSVPHLNECYLFVLCAKALVSKWQVCFRGKLRGTITAKQYGNFLFYRHLEIKTMLPIWITERMWGKKKSVLRHNRQLNDHILYHIASPFYCPVTLEYNQHPAVQWKEKCISLWSTR